MEKIVAILVVVIVLYVAIMVAPKWFDESNMVCYALGLWIGLSIVGILTINKLEELTEPKMIQ